MAKVSIPSDGITIGGACEDVEKGQAANLELKWKGFDFLILFVKVSCLYCLASYSYMALIFFNLSFCLIIQNKIF